ncbi:MAG TPA: SH3 domain-containing protein [Candidatus Acidoferrales bacterium]|nr:SH3 domain-containing protein [Candidatus Acidoferrales bacterium]
MMKTIWTILGTLMAASLFAQNNPNTLPAVPPPVSSPAAETPPPATPAPAPSTTATPPVKHIKKHHLVKHKAAAAPAKEEPTVTLSPGPAQVGAGELTVRGQAGLKGEAVAHLTKGETVNVLEQINLSHHAAGEPSQWAKISYPTNGHVWVMAKFVKDGTVSTKKLNLRAGPGENFSVVGVIDQGAPVNQIETKGGWMKIDPPSSAYAFVAAKFLTQEAMPPGAVAANPETPESTPTPTQVQPPPQMAMTPPPQPAPPVNVPPPAPPQPTVRIVQHEGVVGGVGSVIAPTAYKLYDPKTMLDIDFLYPTSPDQDLSKLVDSRVIVTGEEGVDARWPNIPVIAIQNIQILGKNVIKRLDLTPPKQRH